MNNISVVTGASGFIGSHLVDRLLQEGHTVRCILRKSSSKQWLENKPVEIYDCGLFDKNSLKDILKDATYLFHIAGVVKAKKKEDYFKGNVETTRVLLDVLTEVNPNINRVLITSSMSACGPSLDGEPCTEETTEHPITTYGRSKLAQEEIAIKYMDKLPITIVRLHAVYGERDTEVYQFFKAYNKGIMVTVGFNEKKINLVHVSDAVNGIFLATINEKSKNQTYFIASEEIYDSNKISQSMAKAFGKKAHILRLPHGVVYALAAITQFFSMFGKKPATLNWEKARDMVQSNWSCRITKAKMDFNYSQLISLDEGMKRTLDWYREMKWL
jgi:nucleoside-diphosphate-sugar epimerase